MVIGSEQHKKSGAAYVFKRSNGQWVQDTELLPSVSKSRTNALLGKSIRVDKSYRRDNITIIVGAPGQALAYVFAYDMNNGRWDEQAVLKAKDNSIMVNEIQFGRRGAIVLNGDVASWSVWSTLRSSEYDYDLYDNEHSVHHVHRQSFVVALDISGRSLLVGAKLLHVCVFALFSSRRRTNKSGFSGVFKPLRMGMRWGCTFYWLYFITKGVDQFIQHTCV